jgi:hypothetical protein
MDYTDFMVDRAQHMRPLEYDLSEIHNVLVRYLHDFGVLDNLPVATLGPADSLSASDALSAPLRSLVVGGNSVQDGTPTPDAPVPIQSVVNLALHANDTQGVMWWNQLIKPNPRSLSSKGVTYTSTSDGKVTLDGTATGPESFTSSLRFNVVGGHKYAYRGADPARTVFATVVGIGSNLNSESIYTATANTANVTLSVTIGSTFTGTYECYPQLFDLTAMFGAGNEPATVAEFEALFPDAYYPYDAGTWIDGPNWPVMIQLAQPLRSLPDGTRDTVKYAYLRPSTREGWSWYEAEVIHETGQTTQAVTDGITGIVGVDVMSTTGEIADGPIVVYKLATPTTELLPAIELPSIFGPNFTLWGVSEATPQLTAQYIQNISVSMSDMQTAIADIISG